MQYNTKNITLYAVCCLCTYVHRTGIGVDAHVLSSIILLYVFTDLLSLYHYINICFKCFSYFYILLAFLFENRSDVLSSILRNLFASQSGM